MGSISLTTAQEQAIVTALTPASSIPPPTVTPPTVTDGPTLYASYCAGCHSALATSTKTGITLARLQNAIAGNTGGMGSISLTTAQEQAIVTALTPASTPPPPVTDGPTLYTNYCASCHGALATSTKGGATSTRIQTAITNNTGGMGSLSTLTATQVSAIATALAGVTAPAATCGSCHAIPPATGKHAFHTSQGIICATCHGSGYSATTVNAATHANGVVNLTTTIGWNTTSRSCSNSCHGSKSW
jgi:mono/diheme cytochrome c family protein